MGVKQHCGCCAVLVAIIGIAVACLQQYLTNPVNAKAAVYQIVKMGGIPESIFDNVRVSDESIWYDIITKGNLGIAEGYMHGKVDVDAYELFTKIMNGTSIGTRRTEGSDGLKMVMQIAELPTYIAGLLTNQQTREKATRVTKQHYDAGNDLYEKMLGPSMSYTCAYWKGAKNLDEAQFNKFDLIRRKLDLQPGMKVADLGMGWGTAAAHMHKEANIDVTGVSLSEQQVKWATDNLAKPGLKFIWSDYRDHCEDPQFQGYYDRIYSIGMLEHIGYKNYKEFFKCIKTLLKPEGLAVVHTIGEPDFLAAADPFFDKYIFPGTVIPTMSSLTAALEDHFILEDWQNFGHDYAPTLAAWSVNSKKFFLEKPDAYSPEFQRMWEYYLKMCEVLFELRINQLWHFVLSPRPALRKRIDRQL